MDGPRPNSILTGDEDIYCFPGSRPLGSTRTLVAFYFKFRFRHRNELNVDSRGVPDPEVFIGWHNQELLGLPRQIRPGVLALVPDCWDEEV